MQRIPSGSTNREITFVAVDATDLKTRETGLSSFTVYRSRNGAAPVVYTTPTISELSAANMPGVYTLLVDEDTSLTAGRDVEVYTLHITEAAMSPVSIVIELFRPDTTEGNTLDVTSTGAGGLDWGNIENPTTTVDLSATDINLVDTTTTNTDMRGTESALLAANVPTNFSDLAITVTTGRVDINANNDKTGYSLASGALDSAALDATAVTEMRSLVSGTADSGSTTTIVDAVRTEADTDYWKGAWVLITSGTAINQVRLITGFNAATDTITFSPALTQAITTNTYEILPAGGVDARLWNGTAMSALISGRVDADTQAMGTDVITNTQIAAGAITSSEAPNLDAAITTRLAPTTVGRTLDVTVGGTAGIDWSNIEAPTTAVDLSGTDIQLVDTTTTNTDMRGTESAFLAASAPTNFSDLSITVTTGLVDINMAQTTPGSPTADTVGEALRRAHQQLPELPEKNAAFTFHFSMVDETDHVTPETGLSITANVAKDAASEGAAAGTVTEIGSGTYRFAATSADMNADIITFRFAATGADDTKITMMTTVAI